MVEIVSLEQRRDNCIRRILVDLRAHGPSAIFDYLPQMQWFWKRDRKAFEKIRFVLEYEMGVDRADVIDMVTDEHDWDCVCRKCLVRRDIEVRKMLVLGSEAGDGAFKRSNGEDDGSPPTNTPG